jgi:hypothetical protein
MAEESQTKRWRKRLNQLRNEQSDWRSHWKEIVEYLLPRKGRYLDGQNSSQDNDGTKKHGKILNGTPAEAMRTLAAGLQGGLTSPSRPWFSLTVADEQLAEVESVRTWLHDVRQAIMVILSRSNFYGSIHSLYYELGGFGTAPMLVEEDPDTVVRFRPLTIGEYCLTLDSRYRPESLYRQFSMTAGQIREKFEEKNLPQVVKAAIDQKNLDQRFEVVHVIEKAEFVDPNRADSKGMPWRSVYFMLSGDDDTLLRDSGYRSMPFVAPRWDVAGVDTYGSSPAMAALGDIKMLQKMEEKKLKALDKMVDPPMNAPASMRNTGGNIVAGGVNYLDPNEGAMGFKPAYEVRPDLQNIAFEMDRVERRIRQVFFNDLFLAVIAENKQMTATEVSKRYEEKLMMLGPVLERLQSELLDPIIDRVFSVMAEMNLLPPIPKELPAGMAIKIEYVSMLAQAQRMVGTQSIEQMVMFVGQVAPVAPEILDKVNFDEVADQYGGMLGVPPKIIRPDDQVEQIRKQKQAQMAAMQMAQMAQPAAQAATAVQKLGQTPVQGGQASALDALTGAAKR